MRMCPGEFYMHPYSGQKKTSDPLTGIIGGCDAP